MDAVLLKATGEKEIVHPKNGKTFQLEELYELIGCETIEIIPAASRQCVLILDEEGKLKDHPRINDEATRLSGLWSRDYIVGNAVYCKKTMIK